jgi:nitrate reductase NapAB chaperone NapD
LPDIIRAGEELITHIDLKVEMPIKSYIAIPLDGTRKELESRILKISGCEVIAAENRDVLVVITDTNSNELDEKVHQQLLSIPLIKHLTLVSGFAQ